MDEYARFKNDLTSNKELRDLVKKVEDVESLLEVASKFGYSFTKGDMSA